MFRPMRRCGQQLKLNECIEILKAEPRGVLSLLGDNGYPYGIPMDHWYCEQDGKLYFHGAKNGHKIDSLQSCDKVSYCAGNSLMIQTISTMRSNIFFPMYSVWS